MAAPVITISSDISEESVGSVVSQVILFSTIPIEILIATVMPTNLPTTPELPAVPPFLCSNNLSLSQLMSYLQDTCHLDLMITWFLKIPVIPTPPALSTKITIASPICMSTPGIIASLAIRSSIRTTARKSTLGLRPVMTPAHSAALRKARQADFHMRHHHSILHLDLHQIQHRIL
nr:hypothetical protein [Tanacetum cinerariifolium]